MDEHKTLKGKHQSFWKGSNFPLSVHAVHLLPITLKLLTRECNSVSMAKDHLSQMRSERWLVSILLCANTWSSSRWWIQSDRSLTSGSFCLCMWKSLGGKHNLGYQVLDVAVHCGRRGNTMMGRMREIWSSKAAGSMTACEPAAHLLWSMTFQWLFITDQIFHQKNLRKCFIPEHKANLFPWCKVPHVLVCLCGCC